MNRIFEWFAITLTFFVLTNDSLKMLRLVCREFRKRFLFFLKKKNKDHAIHGEVIC